MISFCPDTGRRPHLLAAAALQVPADDIPMWHRSPSPRTVTLAEAGDHDRHNQRSRRIALQQVPELITTQRGTPEFADHQNVQCEFGGVPRALNFADLRFRSSSSPAPPFVVTFRNSTELQPLTFAAVSSPVPTDDVLVTRLNFSPPPPVTATTAPPVAQANLRYRIAI